MEAEFETRTRNEISQEIIDLKSEDMSWKDFYYRIMFFRSNKMTPDEYCLDGDLLGVKILAHMNPPILPTRRGLELAAANGHLNIIKYLASLGILPDQRAVNAAAEHGHLVTVQYLTDLGIFPDQRAVDVAAEYGHLATVQFLDPLGIHPTQGNRAVPSQTYGLASKYMSAPMTEKQMEMAIQRGDLQAIENVFAIGFIPTHTAIQQAIRAGQIDILKYLVTMGIIPTTTDANMAAARGELAILKYLGSLGILPSPDAADRAIFNEYLDVLKYLLSLGVRPTAYGIALAQEYGNDQILKTLGIY